MEKRRYKTNYGIKFDDILKVLENTYVIDKETGEILDKNNIVADILAAAGGRF